MEKGVLFKCEFIIGRSLKALARTRLAISLYLQIHESKQNSLCAKIGRRITKVYTA